MAVKSQTGKYSLSIAATGAASFLASNKARMLKGDYEDAVVRFGGMNFNIKEMTPINDNQRVVFDKATRTIWMLVASLDEAAVDPGCVAVSDLKAEFAVPDNSWCDVGKLLSTHSHQVILGIHSPGGGSCPEMLEFLDHAAAVGLPEAAVNSVKYLLNHQTTLARQVNGVILVAGNIVKAVSGDDVDQLVKLFCHEQTVVGGTIPIALYRRTGDEDNTYAVMSCCALAAHPDCSPNGVYAINF